MTVALVELAPIDWVGRAPNALIDKRLVCGVSNIVRQSLAADHTARAICGNQQLLACRAARRPARKRRGERRNCGSGGDDGIHGRRPRRIRRP